MDIYLNFKVYVQNSKVYVQNSKVHVQNTKVQIKNYGSGDKFKYIWVEHFFKEINCKKVFNIQNSVWKKTFKTIHQLSCFVGHPVCKALSDPVWINVYNL